MKALLIMFILVLVFVQKACAQLSIINDPDGFVNVREGKSLKAKIIGKLFDGEIFLCDDENSKDEWLWVAFDSNNFKTFNSEPQKKFQSVENETNAFVHRSRIVHLYSLPQPRLTKTWSLNHSALILANDSIKLNISRSAFVAKNHYINFGKAGCPGCPAIVDKIDGKTPIGEDGGMPTFKIQYVGLKVNGIDIKFPADSYNDLYQPKLNNFSVHYDR